MGKKNSRFASGCVALFVTPFFLVGCVTTGVIGKDVFDAIRMSAWTPVPATILSASASEKSSGDGPSWVIRASYSYTVDGETHRATRVGLRDGTAFGSTLRKRARILREHAHSGAPFTARVNPEDPKQAILFTGVQWDHALFLGIFSITFGGVGIGGYIAVIVGRRRERAKAAQSELHPHAPWMWNPDWADGVIASGSRSAMVGLWVFAVLWNAISTPLLFALPGELEKGNKAILIGLLFPLVGLGLLIAAVRATLAWLKYGRTDFVMKSVPGVIGGGLAGAIRIPRPQTFEDDITLRLVNYRLITTGSGKNRSTREVPIWRREHTVPRSAVHAGRHTLIPVQFTIPHSCRTWDEDERVKWRLEVSAPTPGLDLSSTFDVPVFVTPDSDPGITEETIGDPEVSAEAVAAAAQASRVRVRQLAGALELDVPPAIVRAPGATVGLIAFTLLWTGICVVLFRVDAPLLFPIIFSLFGLLMWLGVLSQLTGRSLVRIDAGGITGATRFLVFWRRRTIDADAVSRVEAKVTTQGQSGSRTYPYYSVRVHYRDAARDRNRHIDVADMIGSQAEALWITDLVRNALPTHAE